MKNVKKQKKIFNNFVFIILMHIRKVSILIVYKKYKMDKKTNRKNIKKNNINIVYLNIFSFIILMHNKSKFRYIKRTRARETTNNT